MSFCDLGSTVLYYFYETIRYELIDHRKHNKFKSHDGYVEDEKMRLHLIELQRAFEAPSLGVRPKGHR